jgi:hypothetical protein
VLQLLERTEERIRGLVAGGIAIERIRLHWSTKREGDAFMLCANITIEEDPTDAGRTNH